MIIGDRWQVDEATTLDVDETGEVPIPYTVADLIDDVRQEERERFDWPDVAAEMERQREKWGQQMHTDRNWLAILTEEVGEVAKAILQQGDVKTEVVQCAAVALSWLRSADWDRRWD